VQFAANEAGKLSTRATNAQNSIVARYDDCAAAFGELLTDALQRAS